MIIIDIIKEEVIEVDLEEKEEEGEDTGIIKLMI